MVVNDDDYIVRLVDLPYTVRGMVSDDGSGFYNIYLNARMTREMNQKSFAHEIAHLVNDDFTNDRPIRLVEGL